MATRKTTAKRPRPERYFEQELKGEEAPYFDTLDSLYYACGIYFQLHPWTAIEDSQLVLVEDPVSHDMCYCCVMGRLGQVYMLNVFIGDVGYRSWFEITYGEPHRNVLLTSRCVSVEFTERRELTPPDRVLLQALGHTTDRKSLVPKFRSIRPGFQPWYITDAEAKLLRHCMDAVNVLTLRLRDPKNQGYWEREGQFPLVISDKDNTKIREVTLGVPAEPVPELVPPDAALIEAIRKAAYPRSGIIEIGCIYDVTMIGKKNERKKSVNLVLAIDAKTAFAYPPELSEADLPMPKALMDALIHAMQTAKMIPAEVHVRGRDEEQALDPLAHELGFRVRSMKSLPAFEFAREQMMSFMNK